jgi:RNA polymerase sigma-70 factor (ECF subfamily)
MTEPTSDPSGAVELAESLSMAFLVLLERLSPIERAVFLLREVFDFEYSEIGRVVDKTESNCRQLFARARKQIGGSRQRFKAAPRQADRLLQEFTKASQAGDMEGLIGLLAKDITLWADGGGKAPGAALKPVHGATPVARFVVGVMQRFVPEGTVVRRAEINGQPGFIAYVSGHPLAALVFDIHGNRIRTIYAIGNPDKLHALPRSS